MERDDIAAAAAAGIITDEQAGQLAAFLLARNAGATALLAADSEDVPFARGFHDVFLTIGLAILLAGIVASAGIVVGTLASFLGAGAAWLLAEYYARQRRLVLPSIALALAFVAMVAVGAWSLADGIIAVELADGDVERPWSALIGALAALAASTGFLARFRLPFATGLLAASASGVLLALASVAAPNLVEEFYRPLILVAGLTVFCAAMIYDLCDPARVTSRADNAFWLHLVAAPLIVHAVAGSIATEFEVTIGEAAMILGVIGALGLVALVIDRRAMLVAGLIYLGIAIGALVREAEVDTGSVFAITLLFLGAAVVALGTGWRQARRAVISHLLPARLAKSLPALRTEP